MPQTIPASTGSGWAALTRFVAIGVALYLLLFAAAEYLVYRTGDMNPMFKVAASETGTFDWVILGASHAMPFDFDGFNVTMENNTGLRLLNLAGPGTGPLYNRFVLEQFLRRHRTKNILYVADAFAFRAPAWNEARLADPKLLGRAPFSLAAAGSLICYSFRKSVDPHAALDYLTGFSKINNRDRFRADVWEGEANFDRVFKPSATADKKRIEYLYPAVEDEGAQRARYMREFLDVLDLARAAGARVTVLKLPLPPRFRSLLKGEAEFDAEMAGLAESSGAAFLDLAAAMDAPRFYADTDHLNRDGVTEFFNLHLRAVLLSQKPGGVKDESG